MSMNVGRLARVYASLMRWPVLGPIARFAAAVASLGEMKAVLRDLHARQNALEVVNLPAISQEQSSISRRLRQFESGDLPEITEQIALLGKHRDHLEIQQFPELHDELSRGREAQVALGQEVLALTARMDRESEGSRQSQSELMLRLNDADVRLTARLEEITAQLRQSQSGLMRRLDDADLRLTSQRERITTQLRQSQAGLMLRLDDTDVRLTAQLEEITAQLRGLEADISELRVDTGLQFASATSRFDSVDAAHRQASDELGIRIEAASASAASLIESSAVELRAHTDSQVEAQVAPLRDMPQRVAGLHDSVVYLLERVEFVRRELMFEMRYGAHDPSAGNSQPEVEKRIVNTEKYEQSQQGGMRLNLGCGHIPRPDYLNVDRRELPGVDIVAEVGDLPVEPGGVSEVFSAHLLEHFPQEQLRRELLPYWYSLLKPGGEFRAIVPDAEAMIREYSNGDYPYEYLREVIYGAQDYDGDFHFNMFTPATLSELLTAAGFKDLAVIEAGRRNGACYEFEISARR